MSDNEYETPSEGDPGWVHYDEDDALRIAATSELLTHTGWQAGGWRYTDEPAGRWDFTIKWPDAINVNDSLRTVRVNIHCGPSYIGGWTYGSLWIEGVTGKDIQFNAITPDAGIRDAATAAYADRDNLAPGDAYF